MERTLCDAGFFKRDPIEVAEKLIGGSVTRYRKGKEEGMMMGLLAEIDVLEQLEGKRDDGVYRAFPGTIVRYASSTGFRLAIASHLPGKSGIITLAAMLSDEERLGAEEVYTALGGDILHGRLVGKESGLYLSESSMDFGAEGIVIVRELPRDSPPNRRAYLRLSKSGETTHP